MPVVVPDDDPLRSGGRPPKRRRIWQAIIEAVGPNHCRLACDLLKILTAVCHVTELKTPRINGAVLQSLDRKRLTKQAPPLTAKAVEALETAISSGSLNPTQRIRSLLRWRPHSAL